MLPKQIHFWNILYTISIVLAIGAIIYQGQDSSYPQSVLPYLTLYISAIIFGVGNFLQRVKQIGSKLWLNIIFSVVVTTVFILIGLYFLVTSQSGGIMHGYNY